MKQYNINIALKVFILDKETQTILESHTYDINSIYELYFESNFYLGFSYFSVIFMDNYGLFACKNMANGDLYASIINIGDGVSYIGTDPYKVISWEIYNSNNIKINLAVPDLYIALLTDSFRKIYKKGTSVDSIYQDILKNVGGQAFLSNKVKYEEIPYDLPKFVNSIVFMKKYLLPLTRCNEYINNDYHFYIKNNDLCIISPSLILEPPHFRIMLSSKIKAYEDIEETNIMSTDWSRNYMLAVNSFFNEDTYFGFDENNYNIYEKSFDFSPMLLTNKSGFNFFIKTKDTSQYIYSNINNTIKYFDYNLINKVNKNILCNIVTPLNVIYQTNLVYELNTVSEDNTFLNFWYIGNIWAYSIVHIFVKDNNQKKSGITIIKGIKNGHLFDKNSMPKARGNINQYTIK